MHEKHLKKIETETAEIKKQIMQLEFQHKKDIVAERNRMEAADRRFEDWSTRFNEWDAKMTLKIEHMAKLVGITIEELDNLGDKLMIAGSQLARPRKRSTIS